jgi:hypothetical protein
MSEELSKRRMNELEGKVKQRKNNQTVEDKEPFCAETSCRN